MRILPWLPKRTDANRSKDVTILPDAPEPSAFNQSSEISPFYGGSAGLSGGSLTTSGVMSRTSINQTGSLFT